MYTWNEVFFMDKFVNYESISWKQCDEYPVVFSASANANVFKSVNAVCNVLITFSCSMLKKKGAVIFIKNCLKH